MPARARPKSPLPRTVTASPPSSTLRANHYDQDDDKHYDQDDDSHDDQDSDSKDVDDDDHPCDETS